MTKNNNKLGRGFIDIIKSETYDNMYNEIKNVIMINICDILTNNYQTRSEDSEISEIKQSIEQNGLIQPIIVRKSTKEVGKYEIVVGHRRYAAYQDLGRDKIPAIVEHYSDHQVAILSIVENIQRKNLNIVEEGRAYHVLHNEFNQTHQAIADALGMSRSRITILINMINKLSDTVLKQIQSESIPYSQIRAMLGQDDFEEKVQGIIEAKTTVRNIEKVRAKIFHSTYASLRNTKISIKDLKISLKFRTADDMQIFCNEHSIIEK